MTRRDLILAVWSRFLTTSLIVLLFTLVANGGTARLASDSLVVEIDEETGGWVLLDKRSGVQWPSDGMASPGDAAWLREGLKRGKTAADSIRLIGRTGGAVVFALVDGGGALELKYEKPGNETVRVLRDALAMTGTDGGYAIVPSREGLLVPAKSDKAFKRVFGTSDYEGCHMNMLGFVKKGSALIATWEDAYVFPQL